MKKYSIVIISLIFAFFVSCSSSKSQNDSDTIPDADLDSDYTETVDEDSDSQELDVFDDAHETDDSDSESNDLDSDTDSGKPDKDYDFEMSDDPYCETYGNIDYNVAYNYYGDEPAQSKDPEKVKDLWLKNCGLSQCDECEPKSYDLCAENYPFEPQIIKNGTLPKYESTAGKFQCDALLTPGLWYMDDLAISTQFNEYNGKVLYSMYVYDDSWQVTGSYVYDLNTRKVERIGRGYLDGWQNNTFYFISTYDYKIDSSHQDSPYYGPKNRHLLFYDKETYTYGKAFKMDETPTEILDVRANDTYIFASIHFKRDASDMRIMYTKIGEWDKWKELLYQKETLHGNNRRAGYPSMIGSYVTYFDYNTPIQVQFCDLAVGDSSCFRVSRKDENGRHPIFKDKNTIIYSAQKTNGSGHYIISADISDKNNIKYSELYNGGTMAIAPYDIDDEGKYILIKRRYENPENSEKDIHDYCFYRFSDKATVCFDEAFDLEIDKSEGYISHNELVFISTQDLVVRDLECYCDFYPEKCPLIDYTPNPENPKEPWKRECGSK